MATAPHNLYACLHLLNNRLFYPIEFSHGFAHFSQLVMTNGNNKAARSLPRLSAQGAHFATVLVGPDKKQFVVHQDLLTYHSTFFRAALTGSFKEAEVKAVTLEEEDPLAFEFFVHWMYHKSLPTEDNAPTELLKEWTNESDKGGTKTGNLIQLYVLADKYDIAALKLDTLGELFLHMESNDTGLPGCSQITYAFEHLSISCSLLRYLTDSYCHYAGGYVWRERTAHDFLSAFLDGLLSRYTQYVHGDRESRDDLDLCDYHNHKEDDEKVHCPWGGIVTEE